MAVSQMAAVRKVHAENRIAGFQNREIDRHVGLAPGMRLHIDVLGAEEFFGAIDGEVFDDVDKLATAVIAPAGVAFRVFIGENRTGRFKHRLDM